VHQYPREKGTSCAGMFQRAPSFSFYNIQDHRIESRCEIYRENSPILEKSCTAEVSRERRYRFEAVMIDYRKMFILREYLTEKLSKFTSRGDLEPCVHDARNRSEISIREICM